MAELETVTTTTTEEVIPDNGSETMFMDLYGDLNTASTGLGLDFVYLFFCPKYIYLYLCNNLGINSAFGESECYASNSGQFKHFLKYLLISLTFYFT